MTCCSPLPAGHGDGKRVTSAHTHTRSQVGVASLAILGFTIVCGGPFGIEQAVGQIGAFNTCVGLVLLAVLWALPQVSLCAELATAMPLSGGPVEWVHAGLGQTMGTVNAVLLCLWQVLDMPSGVLLMSAYVSQMAPWLTPGQLFGTRVAVCVASTVLNVVGIDALSLTAGVLSVAVWLPFVVLPIVATQQQDLDASALTPAAAPDGWVSNMPVAVSTLLWCYQGYWAMGTLAAEVKDVSRTFARGAIMAIALCTINFMIPVLVGAAIQPDYSQWDAGYFVTLGQGVKNWLGDWLLAASVLNNISCFFSCHGAYARALQGAALRGDIPLPWLTKDLTRWNTPVPAIVLLCITCCILSAGFSFDAILLLDTTVSTGMCCLVFAAFVGLRYRDPDLPRPFRVPGPNILGAWVVVAPLFAISVFSYYIMATQAWWSLVAAVGVFAAAAGMTWLRNCFRRTHTSKGADDAAACPDSVGVALLDSSINAA